MKFLVSPAHHWLLDQLGMESVDERSLSLSRPPLSLIFRINGYILKTKAKTVLLKKKKTIIRTKKILCSITNSPAFVENSTSM